MSSNNQLPTDLPNLLRRAADDFKDACVSWSYWEAGNSYPTAGRRSELHNLLNNHHEGHHLHEVQRQSFVCTVVALCRMLDKVDKKRGSDRYSIQQVTQIISNPDFDLSRVSRDSCLSTIEASALFKRITSMLGTKSNDRNISELHPKLFRLRDQWLAHSLSFASPSEVNPFLVRDCLVFCGIAIKLSKLLLLGAHWHPQDSWRPAIKHAQNFWDRHEKGFQ